MHRPQAAEDFLAILRTSLWHEGVRIQAVPQYVLELADTVALEVCIRRLPKRLLRRLAGLGGRLLRGRLAGRVAHGFQVSHSIGVDGGEPGIRESDRCLACSLRGQRLDRLVQRRLLRSVAVRGEASRHMVVRGLPNRTDVHKTKYLFGCHEYLPITEPIPAAVADT